MRARDLFFWCSFVALTAHAQYPYAPPPEEQQRVLSAATQFAREYLKRLPDFTCTRTTEHFVASAKTKEWNSQGKVAEELSYYQREEHYRSIAVNDVPNKKVSFWVKAEGWIETHGNFGEILDNVFNREMDAKFAWNGWDYVGGKRVYGFSYHVARHDGGPTSGRCISWVAFTTCKSQTYAYHGVVLIDGDSLEIRRVTHVPEDLPPSLPSGSESVDYGRVTVAGAEYLLPAADKFESTTRKQLFRNDSVYTDYRKFVAASTLKTKIATSSGATAGPGSSNVPARAARPIEAANCFELRDQVARGKGSPLARAWAAAAFNDPQHAEPQLRAVIRSNADGDEVLAARVQLGAVLARAARWREAAEQFQAVDTQREELPEALAKYPPQAVAARAFARLPVTDSEDGFTVPLIINGHSAQFVIDTAAAISAIAESQVKELGMIVHEEHFSIVDITGKQVGCHLAIAGELAAGDFRLRNVPFCALEGGYGEHAGIVGLPVALAFETMRWTRDGNLEIGFAGAKRDLARSNLCFDGSLAVDASIGGRRLALDFDTGNDETFLYAEFADDFPDAAKNSGEKQVYEVEGLGGGIELESAELSELKLRVAGNEVRFEEVSSLVDPLPSQCPGCYGNAGRDLLRGLMKQGRSVTIDFRAMRITVDR